MAKSPSRIRPVGCVAIATDGHNSLAMHQPGDEDQNSARQTMRKVKNPKHPRAARLPRCSLDKAMSFRASRSSGARKADAFYNALQGIGSHSKRRILGCGGPIRTESTLDTIPHRTDTLRRVSLIFASVKQWTGGRATSRTQLNEEEMVEFPLRPYRQFPNISQRGLFKGVYEYADTSRARKNDLSKNESTNRAGLVMPRAMQEV